MAADGSAAPRARLSPFAKVLYGLGDFSTNLVLSAGALLYFTFLTEVAGLRPALAGVAMLIARGVDAFFDPMMGRISDLTRWRVGRRRGYFLLGALPFGLAFAAMWAVPPFGSDAARFAYYATMYLFVSCTMTLVSVPYLALLPEMALDYDERTSLNTYRSIAAVFGTFVAAAMKPLIDALGGGDSAWTWAAVVLAVLVALAWLPVFAVSFERPGFTRPTQIGFFSGTQQLARHASYRTLVIFYLFARTAVDLIAAMFLLYFRHWIGREEDFATTLFLFLAVVVVAQPFWLLVARRTDKRSAFVIGTTWWILFELVIFLARPDWPHWTLYAITTLAAIGYAVADLMPWAMLGEVIDEDELATGERREGLYVGFFTFLRKLGGAGAVALMGLALDMAGFAGNLPREQQSQQALTAIRVLTSLVPAIFLVGAVWVARSYPLDREAHQRIVSEIARRDEARAASGG
jgi:sugar (glycoside-pentoside-hexuronide) transporter